MSESQGFGPDADPASKTPLPKETAFRGNLGSALPPFLPAGSLPLSPAPLGPLHSCPLSQHHLRLHDSPRGSVCSSRALWLPCLLLCISRQRSLMSCAEPSVLTFSFTHRFYGQRREEESKKWSWQNDIQHSPGAAHPAASVPWTHHLACLGEEDEGTGKGPGCAWFETPCLCVPAESQGTQAGCPCRKGSSGPRARIGPAGSVSDYSNRSAPKKKKGISKRRLHRT